MERDDVMVAGFAARSTTQFGLMTAASAAPSGPPPPHTLAAAPTAYRPGECNIGSAEIARRRRSGITGTLATVVVLAVLLATHVAPPFRAILFVPAAVAAAGFLQAWLKFCAGFGWLGVFNFGDVGTTRSVHDGAARAADREKALRIGLASALIGAVVTLIAFTLPS